MKGKVILQSHQIGQRIITIGYAHVSINDVNEYLLWSVEGTVIFKGNAGFGAGTKITVGENATLTFGCHFLITARSEIACFKEITFGSNCLLSWDILVMNTDAHLIYYERGNRINEDKSIKIGNHVWIGWRILVLKGAAIGDGGIVGAGRLVNKKYDYTGIIIAGNPTKIVKENIAWG